MNKKQALRIKRHNRIRSRILGSSQVPRLSIYRGSKHIYAQLIDDSIGKTLIGLSDSKLTKDGSSVSGMERAKALGEALATRAKESKISKIVFDRGGFKYHGQVKVIADTLRQNGITI